MHPGCTKKTLILTLGEEILQKIQISVTVDKIMTVSVKIAKILVKFRQNLAKKWRKTANFDENQNAENLKKT